MVFVGKVGIYAHDKIRRNISKYTRFTCHWHTIIGSVGVFVHQDLSLVILFVLSAIENRISCSDTCSYLWSSKSSKEDTFNTWSQFINNIVEFREVYIYIPFEVFGRNWNDVKNNFMTIGMYFSTIHHQAIGTG